MITRRGFLGGAAAAAVALAQPRGLRLGLDTYTLRGFRWKAIQLLDYAAGLKLDAIQLDLGNYESLEPAYLQKVRDHAARLGLKVDGSMGCICPTSSAWRAANGDPAAYLTTGLRVAKAVGAPCTRVFIGSTAERAALEKHVESTLKVLRAVRSLALDLGVKIAIENHGDFQAWELRDLIETAGKDYVGACLDAGNPTSVVENPLTTIEVLGPYAVTTHIRDTVVFEHPRGAAVQWTALGDGSVDLAGFFERYRRLCPQANVQLEIITGRPPRVVPYLEPDFWKVFPNARAAEFARFVALAKKGGPLMANMIVADERGAPPEYAAALREQQRVDFERSVAYARDVLKLGEFQ